MFEDIDVFGRNFIFTFGGKEKFKSKIGGYFTVLSFFITFYFIWLLGNEILYRSNPKDNQILSLRDEPLNVTLNVPTAFVVQDYRGRIFDNYDRYITFEAFYWRKKRVLGKYEDYMIPENIKMRKCTPSDFSEEVYADFMKLGLQSGKCMDNSFKELGGDFTSDFAKFISVKVTPCYNTTERKTCAPHEESFAFLNTKTLVLSIKSEKIIYNSRDFEKPVKKVIGEDNILADPYIFNFPRYEMYEFRIETDDSLIGEHVSVNSYYEYVFLNDIITSFDNQGKVPTDFREIILFEYSFFESPTVKTRTRSYIKLTDVLASLGGILKIYLSIFNFVFYKIYQRIMYEQVITQIFNFDKVSKHNFKSLIDKKIHLKIKDEVKKSKTQELGGVFSLPNKLDKDIIEEDDSKKPFEKKYKSFMNNFPPKLDSEEGMAVPTSKESPEMITNKSEKNLFQHSLPTIENKKDVQTSSIVSAYFSKKKFQYQTRKKQIFGLTDHLILSFFPCFSRCSYRIAYISNNFNRLITYMNNYIDVLQMMRQFHELERLKFVLFNKKQLAIFQNIGIPEDPFNRKNFSLRLNSFYDFQYDINKQRIKAQEFLEQPKNFENSKISNRLKKMFFS